MLVDIKQNLPLQQLLLLCIWWRNYEQSFNMLQKSSETYNFRQNFSWQTSSSHMSLERSSRIFVKSCIKYYFWTYLFIGYLIILKAVSIKWSLFGTDILAASLPSIMSLNEILNNGHSKETNYANCAMSTYFFLFHLFIYVSNTNSVYETMRLFLKRIFIYNLWQVHCLSLSMHFPLALTYRTLIIFHWWVAGPPLIKLVLCRFYYFVPIISLNVKLVL